MGGAAALAGEGEIARARKRGDAHKERAAISIRHELRSEPKAPSRNLSIKSRTYSFKLHLNEDGRHYGTSRLESLLSLRLPLLLSFSVFPSPSFISHLPSVGIYMSMTSA